MAVEAVPMVLGGAVDSMQWQTYATRHTLCADQESRYSHRLH